jgi:hypothetical protein
MSDVQLEAVVSAIHSELFELRKIASAMEKQSEALNKIADIIVAKYEGDG